MAEAIKVGIIGGGRPGHVHAAGYRAAGGFKIIAVADLIPQRRKRLMVDFDIKTEYASAEELLKNDDVQAVSVCLPNHLHATVASAAIRAGKHVVCESPPALDAKEARRMEAAAARDRRVLLYAMQRRFGGSEQAARQAIAKGYAGDSYHVRAAWTRTRGVPVGTGWFTDKARSGGGAMIDVGAHMLDLGWHLLGQPRPVSAYAVSHQRFRELAPADLPFDVEDAGFAILRFEGGKTMELASSWAINQPPAQNGTICRVNGTKGAIEVYTPQGAVLYRDFGAKGEAKATSLKPPKVTHYVAMMRHFRQCVMAAARPEPGPSDGVTLMQMLDALYKSAESGRSVELKSTPALAAAS